MARFGDLYFHVTHLAAVPQDTGEFRPGPAEPWVPPADIVETENGVVAILEIPGVRADDIDIRLEGRRLIVRGIRRPCPPAGPRAYRQLEIRHGLFERRLELPHAVLETGATARLRDGVLEVFLPRAQKPFLAFVSIRVSGE